jgi:hypothetical protein
MGQWVTATGVAVAVFAATNIDDVLPFVLIGLGLHILKDAQVLLH